MSHREILNAKSMFEKQAQLDEDGQSNNKQDLPNPSNRASNLQDAYDRLRAYARFLDALTKLQGKSVFYVLRCLIRFCFEDPKIL